MLFLPHGEAYCLVLEVGIELLEDELAAVVDGDDKVGTVPDAPLAKAVSLDMTMEGSPQETAVVVHRGKSVPVGRLPERSVLSLSELSACLDFVQEILSQTVCLCKGSQAQYQCREREEQLLGFCHGYGPVIWNRIFNNHAKVQKSVRIIK